MLGGVGVDSIGPPGLLSSGRPPKPVVRGIGLIIAVERIEEDLGVRKPSKLLGNGRLPPIHGLVEGGKETWTPCW